MAQENSRFDCLQQVTLARDYFPAFELAAERQGYRLSTFHPHPARRGPQYLTPAYLQWVEQFRRHDRDRRRLGFRHTHFAYISFPVYEQDRRLDLTLFSGYETWGAVPYGFVLACSLPLPVKWAAGRARGQRRRRRGLCPTRGYDLRATPGRCPECGAVPAGLCFGR